MPRLVTRLNADVLTTEHATHTLSHTLTHTSPSAPTSMHGHQCTWRTLQLLSTHTPQPCHSFPTCTHTRTHCTTFTAFCHSSNADRQEANVSFIRACFQSVLMMNISDLPPCCSWIFWDKGLLWNYAVIRMTALIRHWDWISHLLGSYAEEWYDQTELPCIPKWEYTEGFGFKIRHAVFILSG